MLLAYRTERACVYRVYIRIIIHLYDTDNANFTSEIMRFINVAKFLLTFEKFGTKGPGKRIRFASTHSYRIFAVS